MRLSRLIADFTLIEARLTQSLSCNVRLETQVALTRRAATLMDSIEQHDPESLDDLQTKIQFFLGRARRNRSRRELGIALDLITRFENPIALHPPCQSRSIQPHEVLNRLALRGAEARDIAANLTKQPWRGSLVDSDFRHICTSRGNLEFHGVRRDRFDGLHMGDLVGAHRYQTRCLGYMRSALSGHAPTYYYPLDVPGLGTRVIQCAMRPWRVPTGQVSGLLVLAMDVTDRLTGQHGFTDIPSTAPDRAP